MNRNVFARTGRVRKLVTGGALATLLLYVGATAVGEVSEEAKRRGRTDIRLFAAPGVTLVGNAVSCGLLSEGKVCKELNDSPSIPGGFWPKNSPNAYIFNTGLQVAGIIGADGGAWAGDTTATFFFDSKGTTEHGDPLSSIYRSLEPGDLDIWGEDAQAPGDPADAIISDTDLFPDVLIGRKAGSQEDSWVQYWDGNPARISGRVHPLGIMVTQRSLAWNFPSGNESLLYFIFKFTNITNTPEFRIPNQNSFFAGDDALPEAGYTITDTYAAFGTDMDVTSVATNNYSTVILPFDMGLSYAGGFAAPSFVYPPEIFFAPFFTNAPGIVGIKYLKSPIRPGSEPPEEVGLTLFGITDNQSNFFGDAGDDKQLYRYLSGQLDPGQGDQECNVVAEVTSSNPSLVERSVCYVAQTASDTRFFQASGPFEIAPGQDATIVTAYIMAPTVATMPNGDPSGIIANSSDANANPPGFPSFHPGYGSSRGCDPLGAGCTVVVSAAENVVKSIEKGAGWVAYNGPTPTGRANGELEGPENKFDQSQVEVVPGSLLGRALVAQTIFDNKFLLGFAPDPPAFYLVPGNNAVTIVWEPTATEETGDPFADTALDPESALFNPNYRRFDVEGYRIWRSTLGGEAPVLIAQQDYGTTSFSDATCETVGPTDDIGNPAGLGFAGGETCTLTEPVVASIDNNLMFNNAGAGGAPGAGVVRLADGSALATGVFGAVDDGLPTQPLNDGGVTFVFTDNNVVNNFTYIYSVAAFDVNSPTSGPSTLRSARIDQFTAPRSDAPNVLNASLLVAISGDDGEPLDPGAPMPPISSADGTFGGPIPATNGVILSFAPDLPRLLPTFSLGARIDSLVPVAAAIPGACPAGFTALGTCWILYGAVLDDGAEQPFVIDGWTPVWSAFDGPSHNDYNVVEQEVPFDQEALDAFGIPSGSGFATATLSFEEAINYSTWEGQQNRRNVVSSTIHGGSRWFDDEAESTPDPTRFIRVGDLEVIDSVWAPIHHTAIAPGAATYSGSSEMQCFGYAIAFLGRAADVRFTWGGGTFSEVKDVTHNVPVNFANVPRGSWGFLNTDANGNGFLDWQDFDYLETLIESTSDDVNMGFCEFSDAGMSPMDPAQTVFLEQSPVIMPTSTSGGNPLTNPSSMVETGQGFALYVNAERYIFETATLPEDGEVWTLRTYNGAIQASASGFDSDDPTGYTYLTSYAGSPGLRSPVVPGLNLGFLVEAATNFGGEVDLAKIHTVPDPFLSTSQYDLGNTEHRLQFVNLPPAATIRIYTLTGILVDVVDHADVTGGGRVEWDLRNRNDNFVASGVYFFHVITPEGDEHVGKFTVVNFGAQN